MSLPTDETYLHIYGYSVRNIAHDYDPRSNAFLQSRQWATTQIFYSSQEEVIEEPEPPLWCMDFALGLDHIKADTGWCSDVIALMEFVQTLQFEIDNEFIVEVVYSKKSWHSEHIAFIDDEVRDHSLVCEIIQRVVP